MRVQMHRPSAASVSFILIALLLGCGSTAKRHQVAEARAGFAAEVDRMLVRTATLEITTSEVSEAAGKAEAIAREVGGYVETSSMTEDRRASLRLRVPSANLDAILDRLASLGKEKHRQVGSRDVTDQVTDLEATLKNKVAFRDRLRQLLDRANTVDEVIQVEEHLTRLQAEIDSMEGRLKYLRDQVALAAVDLTIERGRILGPLGYLGYGLWWVFSKLFVIQ